MIQQENFTKISVVAEDVALIRERVSDCIRQPLSHSLQTLTIISQLEKLSELHLPSIYRDDNLFPVRKIKVSTRENGRTVVGSSVLSAQVDGIADGTELDSPVQLFFVLNNASVPGPNENAIRCAFWDINAAGELVSCTSTLCILLHLVLLLLLPLHLFLLLFLTRCSW